MALSNSSNSVLKISSVCLQSLRSDLNRLVSVSGFLIFSCGLHLRIKSDRRFKAIAAI